MAEILVRGHAEARLAPTSASFTVTVRVTGQASQEAAVQEAARACEAVDALLDGRREGVVTAVVPTSLRTGQEWDHSGSGGGQRRRLVGYFATRTSEVECAADGEGLTALIGALSRQAGTVVAGPEWRVAPDADGLDEVRAAATADARRRAEAFASGVGSRVGHVAWIAEPGLRIRGGGGVGGDSMAVGSPRAMRAAAAHVGDGEEALAVRIAPEPVVVSVTVEVGFDVVEG